MVELTFLTACFHLAGPELTDPDFHDLPTLNAGRFPPQIANAASV
jgi:hypothetical protein